MKMKMKKGFILSIKTKTCMLYVAFLIRQETELVIIDASKSFKSIITLYNSCDTTDFSKPMIP